MFTKRRDDLKRHAGEISFPGGRRDPEDADLTATALREAHEEIGLPPDAVEIVGALPPTPTFVTNYAVYPFVGLIEPGFAVGARGGRGRLRARAAARDGARRPRRAAPGPQAACRSGPTPTRSATT